ncbi:MAG: carbohydrate porin [Erythrobacter sp.]
MRFAPSENFRFGAAPRAFRNCSFAALLAFGTCFSNPALAADGGSLFEEFDAEFAALSTDNADASQNSADTPPIGPVSVVSAAAAPAASVPPSAPSPKPVDARFSISQFIDAPVVGDAPGTVRYSGRIDAYFDIKGSVFGIDDSVVLTVRPEFTWGEDSNGEIGLIPSNTALFRGEGAGDFDLSLSVSKRWQSGTRLTVGKVNVLDLGGQLPVVGSNGHFGFQNLSVALPPSAIIPNTITGALLEVPTDDVLYRLWVFDPDSQFERTGFETAFSSGVGFLGSITVPTRIGGQPGFYALKLSGSTRNDINADSLPAVLIPAPGSSFGNSRGEFAAVLAGYQFISTYPEAPGKGWGVFGQIYGSIGDPTFLDYSGFIGLSGNPRSRPQDRFGAAWFRYSLTDDLVDVLAPRLGLEDEEGVEVFYTLGIADRFELTANAQVIDSAIVARDPGLLLGMRINANF